MDGRKILARLLNAGTPLIVVGALLVFLSKKITARMPDEKRETANLIVKAAGTVLVVAGAVVVFATA